MASYEITESFVIIKCEDRSIFIPLKKFTEAQYVEVERIRNNGETQIVFSTASGDNTYITVPLSYESTLSMVESIPM